MHPREGAKGAEAHTARMRCLYGGVIMHVLGGAGHLSRRLGLKEEKRTHGGSACLRVYVSVSDFFLQQPVPVPALVLGCDGKRTMERGWRMEARNIDSGTKRLYRNRK